MYPFLSRDLVINLTNEREAVERKDVLGETEEGGDARLKIRKRSK